MQYYDYARVKDDRRLTIKRETSNWLFRFTWKMAVRMICVSVCGGHINTSISYDF